MLYHNITPSNFFEEYSKLFVEITNAGRQELSMLKDEFDYCLADSEYKKQELIDVGYKVPIDILPIKYPMFFINKLFVKNFTDWHDMALKYGNNIICISQSVADDIVKYFQEKNIFRREPLKIYNFPLGANFIDRKNINTKFVRRALKNFVSNKTFLMVGTIEPRKGHMIALKAIINLVNQG